MNRLDELRARFRAAQEARTRALSSGDPVAFAASLGITADDWQERVLRSSSKRLLLNIHRQAGKSTTSAVLALHGAVFQPKSLTLLVSPSDRQSGELFQKVADLLRDMPNAPGRTEDNKRSVRLENGSRIVSLPSSEDTIRGFSAVTRIIEDEAAFVDDEVFAAILPMLAVSDGQLLLMSTPNGRRGHFFEAFERGGDDWERYTVKASQNPRIRPDFLEQVRRTIGEARYRQEFECEFIASRTGLVYHRFGHDRNVVDALPELEFHVLAIDYGFADECAFCVLGWRAHDPCVYVVECHKAAGMIPSEAAEIAHELERQYKTVKIVGDVGGLGKGYAEEGRKRFNVPIEPAQKNNKRGYIDLLNDALASGKLKVRRSTTTQLVEEWAALPWAENRDKEAPGYANHCADACLYGWRATTAYHERVEERPPPKGSVEALRAEEARLEQAALDELADDARNARRGRWWRTKT